MRYTLAISKLIVLILGLVCISSCGTNEYEKIPLDSLDLKLKKRGSVVVKDILASINHSDGARFLLHKDYMTPMVHGRIIHNSELYSKTYEMIPKIIGKVLKYKLFQVVDKGLVKTMRYKLETDAEDLKFIELKLDINIEYGLADYYLYVTSNNGMLKRQNILPIAIK